MTSVTLYGAAKASTTLTTAGSLFSATGGTSGGTFSQIGTVTGWGEVYGKGTAGAWSGVGSEPAPSGNGWLWDVTTLEGQTLSGNITVQLACRDDTSAHTFTATPHIRLCKRTSGGTITTLLDMAGVSTAFTNTFAVFSITGTLSNANFATGDKLYVDMPANITVAGSTSDQWSNRQATSTSTAGSATNFEIDGLSYVPTTQPSSGGTLALMGVG